MDLKKIAHVQPSETPKQTPSIVIKSSVKAGVVDINYIARRFDVATYIMRR